MVILFILVAVVIMIFSYQAEKKRREALRQFAHARSLSYFPDKDRNFSRSFRDFSFLHHGSNRYARYMMRGEVNGKQLMMCEYHYQVTRSNGKSSSTQHYFFTLVMLKPDYDLKPLLIRREGIFDRMKATFGWDDIDFSSAEFSNEFHVSSPDRDWAFAVIQPKTMDLLMRASSDLSFYMQHGWLLLCVKKRMDLNRLDRLVERGCQLLDGIPDFCKERV